MQNSITQILSNLGIQELNPAYSTGSQWGGSTTDKIIESFSPANGEKIAAVQTATPSDYEKVIQQASEAFPLWRSIPAPKRGEIVRQLGEELRVKKNDLGTLVSYEMGKSLQ